MTDPALERLPWDSEFFGIPIARLHPDRLGEEPLQAVVDRADAQQLRCLYLLVDAGDPASVVEAERLGFRVYDVRVELERALDGGEPVPDGIRSASDADRPGLERLARTRFLSTRFFADLHFPRDRSAELYVAWLDRALASAPRRAVLVRAAPDGFVIVGLEPALGTGVIELIAVDSGAAGRGGGSALVAAANAACAAAGLRAMRVVTQGANVAAQRLYQRHGYRTAATGLWLHRWRES